MLTTVIILVSSVVLGSGVVAYGTSLFQGGTQSEAITVSGVKMWVHGTDSNGLAWGAAKIRNTGDKVLSVDTISVRGTDVPFNQWYADTSVNSTTFQLALNHTGWSNVAGGINDDTTCTGGPFSIEIGLNSEKTNDSSICANSVTGPIGLTPGSSVVAYFHLTNGTLTSLDSGSSITVNIFAGSAGAPQSVTVTGITNTG